MSTIRDDGHFLTNCEPGKTATRTCWYGILLVPYKKTNNGEQKFTITMEQLKTIYRVSCGLGIYWAFIPIADSRRVHLINKRQATSIYSQGGEGRREGCKYNIPRIAYHTNFSI